MKSADIGNIRVVIADAIPVDDQLALYIDAGWWDPDDDPAALPRIVAGSFLVAAALTADGRLVGMGRVISDGVSDGYIQDVVVASRLRGHGIGAQLVRLLADESVRRGLRWVGLVAAPGTEAFYRSIGFEVMENHTPMLIKVPKGGGDE